MRTLSCGALLCRVRSNLLLDFLTPLGASCEAMLPQLVTSDGAPDLPTDVAVVDRRTSVERLWAYLNRPLTPASRFGDCALVLFLVAQVLDGGLTYLGVATFGRSVEANPLLNWLMHTVGDGPALAVAKLVAGGCGIALYLTAVHKIVALLTAFYLAAAILPWASILFW
jgi:hypothetical protein